MRVFSSFGSSTSITPEGSVYVVDERFRRSANHRDGWKNCNLSTTFKKIVRRAGLESWPKLFHNLRASRATELVRMFPSHVVAAWLGHTETIADKHYRKVTADDCTRRCRKRCSMGRKQVAATRDRGVRLQNFRRIPTLANTCEKLTGRHRTRTCDPYRVSQPGKSPNYQHFPRENAILPTLLSFAICRTVSRGITRFRCQSPREVCH